MRTTMLAGLVLAIALTGATSRAQTTDPSILLRDSYNPGAWTTSFPPGSAPPSAVDILVTATEGGWVKLVIDAYVVGDAPWWLAPSAPFPLGSVHGLSAPAPNTPISVHPAVFPLAIESILSDPATVGATFLPVLQNLGVSDFATDHVAWKTNPLASTQIDQWEGTLSGAPYGDVLSTKSFDVEAVYKAAVGIRGVRQGVSFKEINDYFESSAYHNGLYNGTPAMYLHIQPLYVRDPAGTPGTAWNSAPPIVLPPYTRAGTGRTLRVRKGIPSTGKLTSASLGRSFQPNEVVYFDLTLPPPVLVYFPKAGGGMLRAGARSAFHFSHPFRLRLTVPEGITTGTIWATGPGMATPIEIGEVATVQAP